jgi:hypothetical protein
MKGLKAGYILKLFFPCFAHKNDAWPYNNKKTDRIPAINQSIADFQPVAFESELVE